jgi:hypothetical protein
MSDQGTYSFLPWLRQGLANEIKTSDFAPGVKLRATVDIQLEVRGDKLTTGIESVPITRNITLFGPGDIVGIDKRAIVRTDPRDWITNFEPNYLAHVEFYDEDFPWRYTPAAPDLSKGRLRPWLALIVLREDEFTDGKSVTGAPLPYIDVVDLNAFPRADELWAWAHVHVNQSLAANNAEFVSRDMAAVIPKLEALLRNNPDHAYSRLVCPRKLAENTAYHAFLVPVFEAGRRAGLNLELGDISATMSAWDPGTRPLGQSFPYYHRWFFRTATTGDFETLVRLLVPKPVDPRVGTREMDVLDPGSDVDGLDKPELEGILKLGGALRPPSPDPPVPPDKYETWDVPFPRPLQEDLAGLINLPDELLAAGHPDPIITPPLYGRWHALTSRVLTESNGTSITPAENWIHRLNLDPRFRVAAGFGTRVIQDNQEQYMDAAWGQIGKVLEAQRRIRLGQFALLVSDIWYARHLKPMFEVSQQKGLLLMSPLKKRVVVDGSTVQHAMRSSLVQPPMASSALRRIVRPRGRLLRTLPFDDAKKPDQLFQVVNEGKVSAAPPKVAPTGVFTSSDAVKSIKTDHIPRAIADLLRRYPNFPLLVLVLSVLLAAFLFVLLPLLVILSIAIVVAGLFIYRRLSNWSNTLRAADALDETKQSPEAINQMPPVSNFVISEPDGGFAPQRGGSDSVEAARFKVALRESFSFANASASVGKVPEKAALRLNLVASSAIEAVEPRKTIPRRVLTGVFIPPHIIVDVEQPPTQSFVEPMAYPVIDQPMYEPLSKKSSELFLPNINLIEANSITLLETNQRFIESYMAGLNHEFARELLWREYPTDQRGSSFRQFWDVRSFFNTANLNNEELREKLRDIPPLHKWEKESELGSHDHRDAGGASEDELVLVIRGELLKRYPTAVIYAHRACWQREQTVAADRDKHPCDRSGTIDNTVERRLVGLTPAEETNPPREKVLTPLYEAKVDPDIYFFGFDLTVKEAKGGTGANPNDDPGWFFVIKERPGEPRFGLDSEQQPARSVWNDLSWPEVQPNPPGAFIQIATSQPAYPLVAPGVEDEEKLVQHNDDKNVAWSHDMSSAELAYILWQAPVLVAVHASEMLPK